MTETFDLDTTFNGAIYEAGNVVIPEALLAESALFASLYQRDKNASVFSVESVRAAEHAAGSLRSMA